LSEPFSLRRSGPLVPTLQGMSPRDVSTQEKIDSRFRGKERSHPRGGAQRGFDVQLPSPRVAPIGGTLFSTHSQYIASFVYILARPLHLHSSCGLFAIASPLLFSHRSLTLDCNWEIQSYYRASGRSHAATEQPDLLTSRSAWGDILTVASQLHSRVRSKTRNR